MRADVAKLLTKLGRNDFRYREFADTFADMELWPVFEALLTDERVVGKPMSVLEAKETAPAPTRAPVRPIESSGPPSRPAPAGALPADPAPGMFSGYVRPAAKPAPGAGDLRSFLAGLSSQPRKQGS